MLNAIKQRLDREDEGFTLIELMVVVLIIAILLAIAIPTFLGARNGANARSTQSNLRNGLTAEQTTWTNSQAFSTDTTSTGLAGVEGALSWQTTVSGLKAGDRSVAVYVADPASGATATDYQEVEILGLSKDGNCYAILQSNDPSNSFTAYSVKKNTSPSCGDPTPLPAISGFAANSGSASSQHNTSGAWYQSF